MYDRIGLHKMFRNPFMLRWPTSPDDDAPPRQQGETPEQARERRRLQRQLLPLPPGGAYVCLDDTKTWQLESLPPDGLARIVCEAREERLDRDAYLGVIVEGEGTCAQVLARLDGEDEPDDDGGDNLDDPGGDGPTGNGRKAGGQLRSRLARARC
jgi:hypothetical protein